MRAIRTTTLSVIIGLLVIGAVLDRRDRDFDTFAAPARASASVALGSVVTWYCPGGSGAGGPVEAGLLIVNSGEDERRVTITPAPDGSADVEATSLDVTVAAGQQMAVSLGELAPGAGWVGAVVEVDGPEVVVEQRIFGPSGADTMPCPTRTADLWVAANGSTRLDAEGERLVLMVLNPFPDDAVVDLSFSSDVGLDDREGIVVPAGEVVAVEVTDEVTVAAQVSTTVEAVAGRVAVSRIQVLDGATSGRGIRATPATPHGAAVWVVPHVVRGDGRSERLVVTNPSGDTVAEVDVEVFGTDTNVAVEPFELSVRPGRSAVVDIDLEERLADVSTMAIVVRSLDGLPVAVALDTAMAAGTVDAGGAAGVVGSDVAARRWLVPLERVTDEADSVVVIANPSTLAIATVELRVGDEVVHFVEVGPQRRTVVPTNTLLDVAGVVVVEASAPVVVSRTEVGLTSRSSAIAVVAGDPVAFDQLR